MINENRWFWCGLCNHAAIRCEHCNNISCSGGGCDICNADFEEAGRMVNAGEAPAKEGLPHVAPFEWPTI